MSPVSRTASSRHDPRTSRYSSGVRGLPRATSASPRILLTGVRSSWAMSAEKRDSRLNDSSSRSSMSSKVAASVDSSAGKRPASMRSLSVVERIRRAIAVISATGWSPRRAIW